jgi:lon-related putative ATP-dependent protease
MAKQKALSVNDLAWQCDLDAFTFKTTKELRPGTEVIGQERALRAMDFGLGLGDHGYNIFVLGEGGTGKATAIEASIKAKAKLEKTPDDLCYVFNFSDPDRPKALRLPPAMGRVLQIDMAELLQSLRRDIPKVFESKDYEQHRDEVVDGQQERTKVIFEHLEEKAVAMGFVLKKTVSGLAVVPGKDGKPLAQEDYDKLSKEQKTEIDADTKHIQDKLSDAIREARNIEKDTKQRINELDREVVQYVVNPLISELLDKYSEFSEVASYIEAVKEDVLQSIPDFRPREEVALPIPGLRIPTEEPSFSRYVVNLMVSNLDDDGAPVIIENNPTYYNLFGHVEHKMQYGMASTDFTMIKAGSVHRANGGYLVLNAMDVLKNIFVYDAIKRMIKTREVRIEDAWEQYRLMSTMTLKPEPVPLDVKVVLVGEPYIYYLLYNVDKEYRKLFKVKADFDSRMSNSEEIVHDYARFIAARCADMELRAFDRSAVATVVEYGCRLTSDKEKLTARFGMVEDIVVEASHWAGKDGAKVVTAEHVLTAIKEHKYRNSKFEDNLREYITDGTLMITTEGSVVGQINGIAVLDPGDYAFGKPSRVTASTYMGDSGVVNIEREAKMSGRIHNKAHMILSSFLADRFATDFPITLSATICFEQLYEGIEGDSATCTEFYALMSSLSDVPIKQGFAVTGSMNQRGEVQPVGGINEKIEGFFDVCKARGLTGDEGVIMPRKNVKNLMLKAEVLRAVEDKKFTIYAIDNIDDGLQLLTDKVAGRRGKDGKFPVGTINHLVEKKLRTLAKGIKAFGRPTPLKAKKKPENNNNDNNENNKDKPDKPDKKDKKGKEGI